MTHEICGRVCAAFLLTAGIAFTASGQSDTSAYTALPPNACA